MILLYAKLDVIQYMENVIFLENAIVDQAGEEIFVTSVNLIQAANMDTATVHLGSVFAIQIGAAYYVIKT